MCLGGGGAPSIPAPAPPVAPDKPATRVDPAVTDAKDNERKRAAASQGLAGTTKSAQGSLSDATASTTGQTLLGN